MLDVTDPGKLKSSIAELNLNSGILAGLNSEAEDIKGHVMTCTDNTKGVARPARTKETSSNLCQSF